MMSDLSDLMAKDPLTLTKEDVSEIVAHHRKTCANYAAGLKAPKATKAPKASGPKIDLSSLDLEI
jgi:hypothetical protein